MRIQKRLGSALALGLAATLSLGMVSGCSSSDEDDPNVLNIYSSRHYDVDKEIYASFEKETGIKINVVEGKIGELKSRLKVEQGSPKADLLLTVGGESIYPLVNDKLLQNYDSETINKQVPKNLRGDGWMGMTTRARIIAYAKDRVDPSKIKTYDDIIAPEWKGKILVRPATSSYNQALLASFIEIYGKKEAQYWAKGVTDNMARPPKGNDRDQAKAIAAGQGDLAIMNSYYYVRMMNSSDPAEKAAAEKLGLIFPKDTHLNLSFAGLVKGAKHKDNAMKFMEYVTSEKIQNIYAEKNGEFPVNPEVKLPKIQASWGKFSTQELDFATFGKYREDAVKIFAEVGWK